ncbi:MAG: Na+:solute symporter [Flavobacteriaceae bacterium]|nr:Na+:solute symporter [Flavobacteriaceae bacterium]|tara:strand:- start:1706 stop:3496 length:1791 start_codon:yes stop_codon:yes gene_type:complete
MKLSPLDWYILAGFFIALLLIGFWASKKAGKSVNEFFLSGRNMPWWLLGISMVATTFSADTPNLVTDIVRTNGVSGNWVWWAFLLTGMLTVFVYAKLWRRSEVLTDLEFYELRYGGKGAAFLRGFRAVYLGVFFNIMIMATVCLAAIKIGGVMLGLDPEETLLIACSVAVMYSSIGGLKSVIMTDFFQFTLAMLATFWAAAVIVNLPQVGGLDNLINHPDIIPKLDLIPDISNTELFLTIFLLPLALQWWSVWYPGAEPGGGGYVAQRMLSAKNENHAVWATLLFNFMHYAIRPWPWILVALASLIVFPNLDDLQLAFPDIDSSVIGHDLAYPAMMTLLPSGLLGLLLASLAAAFMSTIASHLNWGSSYVVNDFYKRFLKPDATDRQMVGLGRITTVVLMLLSAGLALLLSNALQAFNILLQVGAGTGLIFILRWFWYRINVYSEITAMIVSFIVALYLQIIHPRLGFEVISPELQLIIGVTITTIIWISVTLLTPTEDQKTLQEFYRKIQPGGIGWKKVVDQATKDGVNIEGQKGVWDVPTGILCMVIGSITIYSFLFSIGYFLYKDFTIAFILLSISIISLYFLNKTWKKLKMV